MTLARQKFLSFIRFSVAYTLFYIWPNFFPWGNPTQLPLTGFEMSLPFVPWTFIIYVSDYLLFFTVICFLEKQAFGIFSRRMFLTLFICGFFFFFFPTIYPRPAYPSNQVWWVQFFMDLVGAADTPLNCFPSMHVALTTVGVLSARTLGKKWFAFFVIWGLAIFITTLTTKQHYLADIVGGLLAATTACLVEWRVLKSRWPTPILEKVLGT